MKNNIWFFGDSNTYGHGLRYGFDYYDDNPDMRKPHFTQLLARHFKCNPVNFASCGSSNEDIKFRLINQMHKFNEGDYVFIQLTYSARTNIFTDMGEFESINTSFGEEVRIKGRVSDESIESLKEFQNNFLDKNASKYETRDLLTIFSIKKELELRKINMIIVTNGVLHESIKKHLKWFTIEEETDGKVDGYGNLGFTAQKPFADFIIKQYRKGNTFINPNPIFWEDVTKVTFDYDKPIKQISTIYEFVGRKDDSKDYKENINYE